MTEQPPKKAKILTRLRINEVSLVDRGAGEQCRVVISKRDDSNDDNGPVKMPDHERRYWAALGATALRHAEERYAKEQGAGAADHEPADDEPENPFSKIFQGVKISESSARAIAKVAADLEQGRMRNMRRCSRYRCARRRGRCRKRRQQRSPGIQGRGLARSIWLAFHSRRGARSPTSQSTRRRNAAASHQN